LYNLSDSLKFRPLQKRPVLSSLTIEVSLYNKCHLIGAGRGHSCH